MQTSNSVTSVSAQGDAETNYDLASLTLSLHAEAATVPSAKAKLQTKVADLTAALESAVAKHGVVVVNDSTQTSLAVHENRQWVKDEHKLLGHKASYSLTFRTSTLDKVSELYDELTSLDDVTVQSTSFILKNKDKLGKRALKDAFKKVTKRFAEECEVLQLNVDDFDIAAYEVSYHDTVRSSNTRSSMKSVGRMAMASMDMDSVESVGAAPAPIQIESGKAKVSVNLEVAFKRKDLVTTK